MVCSFSEFTSNRPNGLHWKYQDRDLSVHRKLLLLCGGLMDIEGNADLLGGEGGSSFLPWASPLSLPRMAPWLISGAAGGESARRALVSAKK